LTVGDLLCVPGALVFPRARPDYGAAYERNVRSASLKSSKAENVMVVQMTRNDLGRIAEWGSVKW
jgi:hypothetical protein